MQSTRSTEKMSDEDASMTSTERVKGLPSLRLSRKQSPDFKAFHNDFLDIGISGLA